ncbi:choice-of-anchor tandem repeat GloVer-containing protein [Ideonella sp. YS5]
MGDAMISRRSFISSGAGVAAQAAAGVLAGLHSGAAVGSTADGTGEFIQTTLYNFKGDYHNPPGPSWIISPVCLASDGNFYGTSYYGGRWGKGTVYRKKPDGHCKVLHDFDATGAQWPMSWPGLIEEGHGRLWGVHFFGGEFGAGIIFRINHPGEFELVHTFTGGRGGANPLGSLILTSDGCFYGTTWQGGLYDHGTVFRLKPGGGFKVIHSFRGGESHPSHPAGALLEGRDGFLYGTTYHGGDHSDGSDYGKGTIFKMDLTGKMAMVHKWTGPARNPTGGLIQTRDGQIFGTTFVGGETASGTLFRLTEQGRVEWLHEFNRFVDGELPVGMLEASDGTVYITLSQGWGRLEDGTIVRMTLDGKTEVVHVFDHLTGGADPVAPLIEDDQGRLIGTTRFSGRMRGHGTMYALTRA